MCQGSVGGSAVGWPPLAIICYLPPSENLTCWETRSRDQGRPREMETPEKKKRTESHKSQQIHPWVYVSFLHLGFLLLFLSLRALCEVGRCAEGQIHPKAL